MEEKSLIKEADEKDPGLVRDIVKTLTKTVKTFNAYPRDNPIYQKFATELFEKFNVFFEHNNELPLDVERQSLLYKENEVYQSEERTDNIALLLFVDGIRQINFHKEITLEEIIDFIDILRRAPRSESDTDDDIVTLLWEKNINNMSYTAVEETVDDELVVEESLLQENSVQDSAGETTISGSSFQWRPMSFSSDFMIEPLSDEEKESVKVELSGIEETSLLSSSIELFFELLSNEKDNEAFPEIMRNLAKIVDLKMQKKDIHGIIEIMDRLKKIAVIYRDPKQSEIINNVLAKAGSIENLRILFAESLDSEDIRNYLLLLEKNAISNMLQILGELQDRKHRRLLCEVLAEVGRQDLSAFSEAIKDERWYLVRNVVMILGMIKEPTALKQIEMVLRHPDLRVRREAVRALEGIQAEYTNKLFLVALKDDDLTVRITALKAMRRFRDLNLFQAIKEKASREELKKKSYSEKREILETLAVLGGENAFPILSDLFKKRWLMEKDEITEIRACAAHGLGLIGTPEAVTLLEKEASSRKGLLREACLKALRESRQSGNISR